MSNLKLNRQLQAFFLLVFVFFSSCAPQKSRESPAVLPEPYLAKEGNGVIYDAAFRYKDFHASGLLVMKRIENSAYHIVLLSKFGPRLMEFKLYEDGISWIKTFDQLDKKSVEKLVERDFRLLLLADLENPEQVKHIKAASEGQVFRLRNSMRTQLVLEPETQRVMMIENRKTFNPVKTKVFFEYGHEAIPKFISLQHDHVKMSMNLKLLKINHAEK